VLIGEADKELLRRLALSPNVSVARAEVSEGERGEGERGETTGGWERGAMAMREAARRRSPYVIVPDDPLAAVATGWRAMWDVSAGQSGPAEFERSAVEALAAWRDKRFEMPDYYLVMADRPADDEGPDMYLGPLRAIRPRRVALTVGGADAAVQSARVIESLRSLSHGPWWPPLDDLLETTRNFYAGGLAPSPDSSS